MTSTEVAPSVGRHGLAALPALLLALLPKFTCPACWPLYGSVLSSLGLGGLLASPWRVPLLAVFLLPALWLLVRGCRGRRRRWPLGLGLAGAAASLVGALGDHGALSLAGSVAFVTAMVAVAAVRGTAAAPQRPAVPSPDRCCRRA